ncbi:MAG: hypothetical protein SFX74_01830 [Fimbriimonadaceae bacterium]|nr:hypothetical protein [Fimbriimonadaceae bacterium]
MERRRGTTGTWEVILNPAANVFSYSDTNVAPTKGYFYRVKAVNADGESDYSTTPEAAVTPAAGPLTMPGDADVNGTAYSKNRLAWTDPNTSEDGYRIERKLGAGPWTLIATTLPNVVGFTDEGLSADTPYVYRVRAYNIGYNSAYTDELNGRTWKPYLSKIAPTGSDVISGPGTYTMRVERTATSPNPLTVHVATSLPHATVPATVTIPANARVVNFTATVSQGVTEAETYYLTGEAEGWAARGDLHARPAGMALAPTDLLATGGDGAVWLKWANPANTFGTSYPGVRVARRTVGGSFAYITPLSDQGEHFVDTTVVGGTTYEYRVDVMNSAGAVAASSDTSVVTANAGTASLFVSGIPSTATGPFTVTTAGTSEEFVRVYVDDQLFTMGSVQQNASQSGAPSAFIDTRLLSSGVHVLRVATENVTERKWSLSTAFTVSGTDSVNVPADSDGIAIPDARMVPTFRKQLPANTLGWTVRLVDRAGVVVREWNGYGSDASVTWDGRRYDGSWAPKGQYTARFSTPVEEHGYCDVTVAAANPEMLFVVMLQKGAGGAYNISKSFADEITSHLSTRYDGTPLDARWAVLVYTESQNISSYVQNYIKYSLHTVRYLYIQGHGSPKSVSLNNMKISAKTARPSGAEFPIGYAIARRDYGLSWLFVDSCSSAGAGPGPFGNMNGESVDLSFAIHGGVQSHTSYGAFIGWNGLALLSVANAYFAPYENVWGRWRKAFMRSFLRYGYSTQNAIWYAHLNSGVPDAQYQPYTVWNDRGILVPKLVGIGDILAP